MESLYDLTKAEQVKLLKELGLKDSEIKKLRYEKQRVEKIIELQVPSKEQIKEDIKEVKKLIDNSKVDPNFEILADEKGLLYVKILR